jgi:hypothetical protein
MIVAARLALFALIAAEKDVMLVIAHEIVSGDELDAAPVEEARGRPSIIED